MVFYFPGSALHRLIALEAGMDNYDQGLTHSEMLGYGYHIYVYTGISPSVGDMIGNAFPITCGDGGEDTGERQGWRKTVQRVHLCSE